MTDELEVVARSMNEVPPLRPEVLARLRRELSALLDDAERRPVRRSHRARRPVRRPHRARRRIVASVAAVAAVLALALLAMTALPGSDPQAPTSATGPATAEQPAVSLVSFTQQDGFIVAEITDPHAAKDQLDATFREHGLDISVALIPVSPSLVGTIVQMSQTEGSSPIEPLQAGPCVTGSGGGCTIGLKIATPYSGHADITVGRDPAPDETYQSSANAFGPGEALHCTGLLNQSVATATQILEGRNLTAEWRERVISPPSGEGSADVEDMKLEVPPADYYVTNAIPVSATRVLVWISAEQGADPGLLQQASQSC